MDKIKVAVFGGSGFGGSELLRILLYHPHAEVVKVTAGENAGNAVADVHQNLRGLTDLRFEPMPDDLGSIDADVAFFALPHGQALKLIPTLAGAVNAIDLSGDFRINDPDEFSKYYKREHPGDIQSRFVYGLSETNRAAIASAQYIANPGCFATATLLALAPLAANGLIDGRFIVDAKTGSSGSGVTPAANTHHPKRMNSFYAYKPFSHQHVPEINQHLTVMGDSGGGLVFMTHSMPVSRGIFASCYAVSRDGLTQEDLEIVYAEYYRDSFFVRMVDGSPDVNWVKNTNFCDIAVHVSGDNIAVFAAIDNLVKGAAGQAVQNMNIMCGLNEKAGLVFTGSNP